MSKELKVTTARLFLERHGGLPKVEEPGIIVVGVPAVNGFPALVLVWDEGVANRGVSATHAIGAVLQWADANWHDFPVREAVVLERDSAQMFDYAVPQWDLKLCRGAGQPSVVWVPLTWAETEPRSLESFKGLFGHNASQALNAVLLVLATEPPSAEVLDE